MKHLNQIVLFSAAYVIIVLLLYISGAETFASTWVSAVRTAILLGILIFSALIIRKTEGGFASFKTMFVALFSIVGVYALSATLIDFVLFKVIDPEFATLLKDITIENTLNSPWMEQANEKQIDGMVKGISERFDDAYTPKGLLGIVGFRVLSWSIISLILAAIFKRKQPDFA